MKTRFLSNMSHEFRTPLNSIRALSRLLLERVDGPLSEEQAKQVALIRKATDDLTDLVDDLLDLAKIAAGKTEVRPTEFAVDELFGMLRSMLRPLLSAETVALHFEDVSALPGLYTDEGKLSQILRNLVSNALKYTERGEVRVSADTLDEGQRICICVRDTGIGIAPEDQERIFEEFTQVTGPLQSRTKGTGLGLPLSRRLAVLLGGTLIVESEPGAGSAFRLTIPVRYAPAPKPVATPDEPAADPRRLGVLVVDSDAQSLHEYEVMLQGTPFQILPARSIRQAQDFFLSNRPAAVVMDVDLRGEHAWGWLSELKSNPETRRLPVIVVSRADDPNKAYALGADAYLNKPPVRGELLAQLETLTSFRVLVIDDDPVARYTMRRFLGPDVAAVEVEDGVSGLRAAAQLQPRMILLDLQLPDINGGEVLRQLKSSPKTRDIPVAIITSLDVDADARMALSRQGAAVLSKSEVSSDTLRELLLGAGAELRMAEA
jgi:CheY-like chemotaxis protein/anti-sigma regulatory factor (Ser/Thr protein kinase)